MIGNPGPWILIAVAILAALWWKGYLKLPASQPKTVGVPVIPAGWVRGTPNLEDYPVDTLAAALSAAARRDAANEYNLKAAAETAKLVRERFAVPFSEPASTGSVPPSP